MDLDGITFSIVAAAGLALAFGASIIRTKLDGMTANQRLSEHLRAPTFVLALRLVGLALFVAAVALRFVLYVL